MKLNKLLFLTPVMFLSLTSCAINHKRYDIKEYFLNYTEANNAKSLDSNGDFNILQLSDIHMGVMDDADTHYKFIKKTVEGAEAILKKESKNLHLITITGDLFTFANKNTVYELCSFFESLDIPWTLTFGNHDEQGYFSINWLTSYLTSLSKKDGSNLLFKDMVDDDVFGNANFVINLPTNGTYSQSRQVIMLDSNRYNYGEGFGYDYIHTDQIDWYQRVENYVDPSANSLAFFHIPVIQFKDAYLDANDGKDNSSFLTSDVYHVYNNEWQLDEEEHIRKDHRDKSEGSPNIETGFYDTVRKLEYTKGIFVGHAHTNTNCMEYRPRNSSSGETSVALCYGVKATDRVYYDDEMMGGQLIRYHAEEKAEQIGPNAGSNWFDLDLIYHKYDDLKEDK